ncbi:D-alanyl-lipoteichoic acid biosynthesis protein DltD [Crocinitomicaceae bacterium]|nr:D-alanyl-lipoteichoic acid biosynthesis protein DltD [Crocinitomicaceae bacterium]
MKSPLKYKLTFEIAAFLASISFIVIALFIVSNRFEKDQSEKNLVFLQVKNPSPDRGLVPNYSNGLSTEMMLMSSLSRKDQLTLFGSSEFSSNPNSSYIYFPEKLGIPTMGFGHAFHQSFSIYCELLAGNEYLKGSKIVIFLSPGWFETEGTNSEAFLEFVPPHFLEKIWMDESISVDYKVEIGRFIAKNAEEFSNLTSRMQTFKTLYESECEVNLASKLRTKLEKNYPVFNKGNKIKYSVEEAPTIQHEAIPNFRNLRGLAQKNFLNACANNNLFVDSLYFNEFILQSDGSLKTGNVKPIDKQNSAEYKDFLLLLKLLKDKEVNCSFVIQGLNPYYYSNLEEMNPIIRSIINELENADFPYLNMFTSRKGDYQPGSLNDVMHLGDYGWLQVNEFIYNTYLK